MEAGAAPDAEGGGDGEHGGALHLTGQYAQPLPRLPFLLQLEADRHSGGGVLAVEAVLALDNAHLAGIAQRRGAVREGPGHGKVGHGGIFDGGILPAGALHAHCAGGHDHIAALHVQPDAAAGADAEEGVYADLMQLLHGDGRRRPADAGADHADLLALQRARPGGELPVGMDKAAVVQQGGNALAAPRVAGQNAVSSRVPLTESDVVLYVPFRHVHAGALLSDAAVRPAAAGLFCSQYSRRRGALQERH